jgi:oligoribonuclease (3'-5' exoribonuclease)
MSSFVPKMLPLVWFDLETTGLDYDKCLIAEIAVAIGTFPVALKNPPKPVFHGVLKLTKQEIKETSNPFCDVQHQQNGLYPECLASTLDCETADLQLCKMIDQTVGTATRLHPAGNSIHFDVTFVRKFLPRFYARLDHRHLDVSSFNLIVKSLGVPSYTEPYPQADKQSDSTSPIVSTSQARHRASPDVEFSFKQMLYNLDVIRNVGLEQHF